MRLTRRARRDQLTTPGNEDLPNGIGGTITGGPMEPIGLLDILERGAQAGRGGAVSGAAQVVADSPSRARGIALSDGSRICFASIADAGLLRDDDAPTASDEPTSARKQTGGPPPKHFKARSRATDKAGAVGTHPARVLVTV